MIEQRIRNKLQACPAVSAIIGTRVHSTYVPSEAVLPAVAVSKVGDPVTLTMAGVANATKARYQLELVSTSTLTNAALELAIKACMNGWSENFAELNLSGAYIEGGVDHQYTQYTPVRLIRFIDLVVMFGSN